MKIELNKEEIEVIKMGLGLLQRELTPMIYKNNPVQFKDAKDMEQYLAIKKDLDNILSVLDKSEDCAEL